MRALLLPAGLLASGEANYAIHEFKQLIERQALDIVQPDICCCGGVLTMLVAATLVTNAVSSGLRARNSCEAGSEATAALMPWYSEVIFKTISPPWLIPTRPKATSNRLMTAAKTGRVTEMSESFIAFPR